MNGASGAARDDTMGCMPAMNRHVFACRSPLYLANTYTSPLICHEQGLHARDGHLQPLGVEKNLRGA